MSASNNRFLERISKGPVTCAEGYVFELERRGYLSAGAYVPEVLIEHPEVVAQLHRDFCRAGSDVVEALTYYVHREKLRLVGKEHMLEEMNRKALRIAKDVAKEFDALVAGNICNSNIWPESDDQKAKDQVRAMFEEQVQWAREEGVDFIIGETFAYLGEALLALEVIKSTGLPAVVTMALMPTGKTRDNPPVDAVDALKQLEAAGAAVTGFNCHSGPWTMLPFLERAAKELKIPVAGLPVPYRTHSSEPTFFQLTDPNTPVPVLNDRPFPVSLDPLLCNRYEIGEFTRRAHAAGVRYMGICCGNGPHFMRAMAEALGRDTPSSKYSPDISKHFAYGSDKALKDANLKAAKDKSVYG